MKLTNKGFTLVEMLIVIVIIGILAAAIFPRLTGIQARARDTARTSDLRQIATALAAWQLDTNSYYSVTTDANNAAAKKDGTWHDAAKMIETFVKEDYLKSAPADPKGLQYSYATNEKVFALAAVSEGAKKGANWGGTAHNSPVAGLVTATDTNAAQIEKRLCAEVKRASGTPTVAVPAADATCGSVNSPEPMQVIAN